MGVGISNTPDKQLDHFYNGSLSATKAAVFTNGDKPGKLYGFCFDNNSASSDVFIQIFDKALANVTVGTTAPDFTFRVPAGAVFGKDAQDLSLHYFVNGCVVACTSTRTGSGSPAANASVNIWYKSQ